MNSEEYGADEVAVELSFVYIYNRNEFEDRGVDEFLEMSADALYEWLHDGNSPELGINAEIKGLQHES